MLLLAFDTATPAVTVALADASAVLTETTTVDARRHGELLAPGIAAVLARAGADRRDVTQVAVGVGPGPFTGLRVGLVTARVLGGALSVPVAGVCTLDVLALAARELDAQGEPDAQGELDAFRVATDARRREVYWAAYRGGVRVEGPHVDRPADVAWAGPVAGAGPRLYPDAFPQARAPELPSAAALCRHVLAGLPTLAPEPLYLRRPDAVEPAGRKPVRA
ncbi:MAG: tRNA (adenosine(37)-N6)-threonylcarbamoyltransferase complex dimerization subunit type 1 TsaB [Actinomycetota bacterium]|nr:tRNA (adenosine(37)-N6)-threonylcarbamoyltransferase complex dimerization subunit type 1 TsaB [Actinomycetota bacterium]